METLGVFGSVCKDRSYQFGDVAPGFLSLRASLSPVCDWPDWDGLFFLLSFSSFHTAWHHEAGVAVQCDCDGRTLEWTSRPGIPEEVDFFDGGSGSRADDAEAEPVGVSVIPDGFRLLGVSHLPVDLRGQAGGRAKILGV